MILAAGILLSLTSAALFAFGFNLLYLSWRSLGAKAPQPSSLPAGREPLVCVQIPIYNERYVAGRVIDAACRLEWPGDRLQVQVLDDSDDETIGLVRRAVARWRGRGVRIEHVRRGERTGYKAGALAHGMTLTEAPFVAIFDADFVPAPDFLRRTLDAFDDPRVGFVQARWGHLNERYSLFTRLQAIAIDFHFLVEQTMRSASGYFTNFTGTAGVWRRAAIADAGGWSAATLTEDLDLSYRAQLRGWRAAYRELLEVPEELPVSMDAYRRQQSRWATGSFQSAFRLLIPVLRSRLPVSVRWQAAVHLLSYAVGPLMLVQLACYPALLWAVAHHDPVAGLGTVGLVLNVISLSPTAGFVIGQVRRGRPWWTGLAGLGCQLVGAGMALTALQALLRARKVGGAFERTPKFRITARGDRWRGRAYVPAWNPTPFAELGLGLAAAGAIVAAVVLHAWLIAIYAGVFAAGNLAVALFSFGQALDLRAVGRRLLRLAPGLAVLLPPAALLLATAQLPLTFEDSYQHWLLAANLAATGHLADPLFAMEDTWLPAYHVLAAGVLAVAGLWQLGALKLLSVGLALATLAVTYGIAGSGRRGRLAVVLLALNPAFLLTATSVVAEPLLAAAVLGATS
ncbi:MAG TPA: glycosyltransferase, partial [Candidatus Acidoferrales bacterium]|nr:glycosyltransferase [Candidatus Acidoferrales bacterium]